MADSDNRMTYDGYLRIQDLLSLQDGPSGYLPKPCHNEMHFIVVHQAFELWFKVILREFDEIHKKDIREGDNIVVERAGDVIPHVIEVVKTKNIKGGDEQ